MAFRIRVVRGFRPSGREKSAALPKLLRKVCSPRAGVPAFSALFFISFFLYLWLCMIPRFFGVSCGCGRFPSFRKGAEFLGSFLPYPGGPIGYWRHSFSQLYYWSWLGSLITHPRSRAALPGDLRSVQASAARGCAPFILSRRSSFCCCTAGTAICLPLSWRCWPRCFS